MSFRLGFSLVERRLLSLEQVEQAFTRQRLLGGSLDTQIVELGWMTPQAIQDALDILQPPPVERDAWLRSPSMEALLRFPPTLARQIQIVPLAYDGRYLHLLASTLTTPEQWPLSYWLGTDILLHYAPEIRIQQALAAFYQAPMIQRFRMLDQRFPADGFFQSPQGWMRSDAQESLPAESKAKIEMVASPAPNLSPLSKVDLSAALNTLRTPQKAALASTSTTRTEIQKDRPDSQEKTLSSSEKTLEKQEIVENSQEKNTENEKAKTEDALEKSLAEKNNSEKTTEGKLSLPPVSSLRSAFRPPRPPQSPQDPAPALLPVPPPVNAATRTNEQNKPKTAPPPSLEKDSPQPSVNPSDFVLPTPNPSINPSAFALPTTTSSPPPPRESTVGTTKPTASVPVLKKSNIPSLVVEAEPTVALMPSLSIEPPQDLPEGEGYTIPALPAFPSDDGRDAVELRESSPLDEVEIDIDFRDVEPSPPPPSYAASASLASQTQNSPLMLLDELLEAPPSESARLMAALAPFGGSVVPLLLERLPTSEAAGKNNDVEQRIKKMADLCETIGEPALLRLMGVLQKEPPLQRSRALLLLGRWLSSRAFSALIRHLLTEEEPPIRRMIRKVILRYQDRSEFEKILIFLRENLISSERARIKKALQLIEELRVVALVAEMIKLLQEKEQEIKDDTLQALRRIALQDFGQDAQRWLQWYSLHQHEARKQWILDALNHEDTSIRLWVQEDLREEFGDDFGYDPHAPTAQRESIRKLAALWLQQR